MLTGLKHRLLEPDAVAEFVRTVEAELKAHAGDARRDQVRHAKRKKVLEQEIAGMMTWMKKGRFTDSMMDELDRLEAEKRELDSLLSQPATKLPTELLTMPDLPSLFRQKVSELERLLEVEETKAEAMDTIRSLIDHVDSDGWTTAPVLDFSVRLRDGPPCWSASW